MQLLKYSYWLTYELNILPKQSKEQKLLELKIDQKVITIRVDHHKQAMIQLANDGYKNNTHNHYKKFEYTQENIVDIDDI